MTRDRIWILCTVLVLVAILYAAASVNRYVPIENEVGFSETGNRKTYNVWVWDRWRGRMCAQIVHARSASNPDPWQERRCPPLR